MRDERVLLVGARDLDDLEQASLVTSAVRLVAAPDVGGGKVLPRALAALANHVREVYLHVDLDVLDPGYARAQTRSRHRTD